MEGRLVPGINVLEMSQLVGWWEYRSSEELVAETGTGWTPACPHSSVSLDMYILVVNLLVLDIYARSLPDFFLDICLFTSQVFYQSFSTVFP